VVGLVATSLLLAGCGVDAPARPQHLASTAEYRPGVAADLYLPPGGVASLAGAAPVVVLVPGGAWQSADRGGLSGLADDLADDGMVVVNATYRASDDGVRFPTPVEDVACAVSWAADQAAGLGVTPRPLVLVGHSAGAHLAALAALAPDDFRGDCAAPPAEPDGLVGLAGAYDVERLADVAVALFGADQQADPEAWARGDALARAGERPELRALLLHGDADTLVPASLSRGLGRALQAGGHDVSVTVVPGATHGSIYGADVAGPLIASWIEDWPEPTG
jgi:acetyl esterase/lipase